MTIRIPYDQQTKQTARMLAQAVNKVAEAIEALNRVDNVLDAAINGDDDAGVVTEVGCSLGQAHDLWAEVSAARDAINHPAILQMVAKLDQG